MSGGDVRFWNSEDCDLFGESGRFGRGHLQLQIWPYSDEINIQAKQGRGLIANITTQFQNRNQPIMGFPRQTRIDALSIDALRAWTAKEDIRDSVLKEMGMVLEAVPMISKRSIDFVICSKTISCAKSGPDQSQYYIYKPEDNSYVLHRKPQHLIGIREL
ncbi:OLC1v1018963C1 [Oldenlandia corymbosa var. corymbosa]|uniref:OLC1v1018963C1 n=1 Tax=Oldenlandia corymbosa var. corymbosa TaxID=529605 RepID=A0AAV1ECZ4_OLDCO|nr:OLC1v1018963C1 [Oldenlandia corymbosa var. corymbosa]